MAVLVQVAQHVGRPVRLIERRVLAEDALLHSGVDLAIGPQPRELRGPPQNLPN